MEPNKSEPVLPFNVIVEILHFKILDFLLELGGYISDSWLADYHTPMSTLNYLLHISPNWRITNFTPYFESHYTISLQILVECTSQNDTQWMLLLTDSFIGSNDY